MHSTRHINAMLLLAFTGAAFAGGGTLPAEFDESTPDINRLFSYFGGVTSWTIANDPHVIHTGGSCRVNINFAPSIFNANGVGLGSYLVSGAALDVPADADYFSITVESPSQGTLSLSVTIREDDNNDGVIDLGNGDDEWVALAQFLQPGTHVYNIPFTQFVESGAGDGNGVKNFTTSGALAYIVTFETRSTNPGGLITIPVTMFIDHAGFFTGPQSIPASSCPGDATGDLTVNVDDLNAVLAAWNTVVGIGAAVDLAGADGFVGVDDLNVVLGSWATVCD